MAVGAKQITSATTRCLFTGWSYSIPLQQKQLNVELLQRQAAPMSPGDPIHGLTLFAVYGFGGSSLINSRTMRSNSITSASVRPVTSATSKVSQRSSYQMVILKVKQSEQIGTDGAWLRLLLYFSATSRLNLSSVSTGFWIDTPSAVHLTPWSEKHHSSGIPLKPPVRRIVSPRNAGRGGSLWAGLWAKQPSTAGELQTKHRRSKRETERLRSMRRLPLMTTILWSFS